MKYWSTPQTEQRGRSRRWPELPRPYSTEPDSFQRFSAFAYWQAQDSRRGAAEELRREAETLSLVLAAQGQIAAAHLDLEQSLEFIAEGARWLTGACGAAIALRDGQKAVCRARSGPMAPELGSYLNPQSGVCGQCLTSGEVQLCDDTEHDRRVNLSRSLGMRSILAVPLRRQEDVLGVIVVFSRWAGVFHERDIRALKLLAGLVIEALWSDEVHRRRATAPDPVELQAPEPLAGPTSSALAEFRDATASSVLPEPAAAMPQCEEVPALVETPVPAEAKLPAPAFAVLGSAEPWRRRRTVAIIAGAIALLASATEAGLWRGTHVRELLHRIRPAVVAAHRATPISTAAPAPKSTNSATTAETTTPVTPEGPSGAVPTDGSSQLLAIRSWWKPEGTTIALFLEAPVRWQSGTLQNPARIYFDLENTEPARDMLGKWREELALQVNDGLVNHVRVGLREASTVRIVIYLAAPAEYSAALSPTEPYRLMIVVRRAQAKTSAATNSAAPSRSEGRTLVPHTALTHPKIVIDPGHGGSEGGAIGHGGLKEKDLTLQISRRLGDLLANRLGAQVIYTRTNDLTVPLEERAAIANQAGADLFISIHANSSADPDARGVETYYVANSPPPVAGSLAGRENAAKGSVLKPVAKDSNLSESRKLAMEVQQALYQVVGREKGVLNRGVKQAPFVVLLDAEMPSILAEVSFVTSPADEHRLSTAEGQEAVADALYRGIAHYLATARQGKVESVPGGGARLEISLPSPKAQVIYQPQSFHDLLVFDGRRQQDAAHRGGLVGEHPQNLEAVGVHRQVQQSVAKNPMIIGDDDTDEVILLMQKQQCLGGF